MTNEELVALIQAGVDVQENMGQLYQQNRNFIVGIALPYSKSCDLDDLMQEAYFGLEKAVQRFEPDRDVLFISYAGIWIRNVIQRYCQNNGNLKRVPVHVVVRISKYQRFRDDYRMTVGEEPSDNQYCAFLGIKKPQLKELRKFMVEADTISFESVAPGTDDLTLGESIPDDFDLEGSVVDTLSEEYAGNLIEEAVSALPDARAGEVIRKCFWENKPLHEVGEQLDISRERVRQIQYKALKRLKIDRRIKEAAEIYGYGSGQAYHWGVGRWKDTGYSSTEFLAIKRIETSDRLKQHLEDTCELNTAIPIIADGVRNRNDGYTPSGIRKLEELNREIDQLIQNRLAERKRIAANG